MSMSMSRIIDELLEDKLCYLNYIPKDIVNILRLYLIPSPPAMDNTKKLRYKVVSSFNGNINYEWMGPRAREL